MTVKDNLSREEARRRAELIRDVSYEIQLDLTGEETFGSVNVLRFRSTEPGADSFVDLLASSVISVVLNGAELGPAAFDGSRIHLPALRAENELRVEAECEFHATGEGMARFEDPVDGAMYFHSNHEPFGAHRVWACFDQPDIKAVHRFDVLVPEGSIALSNAPAQGEPRAEGAAMRWRFGPTLPISSYIATVCAGPFHGATDRHEGIDLGVYCRRSLAEHLDAGEMLEITKQGLAFFQETFGLPYPFGKYDQVFVPEFLAGAMENAGCVTFNEIYIFRSRVTEASRERRAATVLHEMAHMWFGDLVTMRWWNDLWLNESFASYAGDLATAEATRFTEAWSTFAATEKTWATRQDQLPTTHPIVAEVPDVESVHLNFDGITYAKGASVLRQLVAWVGRDAFLEGTRRYFGRHELANAELDDFLSALEETSGRDLQAWSKEWLETSGINVIGVEMTEADGAIGSLRLVQDVASGDDVLRPHRMDVTLYDLVDGSLAARRRVDVDVTGERTEVAELAGEAVPALVLPNAADLAYTKLRLDPRSVDTLMGHLGTLGDPLARAVCWRESWEMVRDAALPARRYLGLVLGNIDGEREIATVQSLLRRAATALDVYADPAHRDEAVSELAEGALERLASAALGSDLQLAWARAFISAATSPEHREIVGGLLEGSAGFEGLEVDIDLRWLAVSSLASSGALGDEGIAAELVRDPTDQGARHAAAARAARPDPGAKAEAWSIIVEAERPLATIEAIMSGFHRAGQEELLRPYASRYFDVLDEVWQRHDLPVALSFSERMYPGLIVERATIDRTREILRGEEVPGPARRLLLEGMDGVERAERARARDAAG